MTSQASAQKLYEQGCSAWQRGQVHHAAEALEAACRANPSHAAAHHLLGKVQAALGDAAGAEQLQRQSCGLDPSLGWNRFALAELLFQRGSYAEASESFAQAADCLPRESWILELAAQARQLHRFNGEALEHGLGPTGYQLWIKDFEPRPPSELVRLRQRWWMGKAPVDRADGWLVLVADDGLLRSGALQALEHMLADWPDSDLPDLLYCNEDRLDASGRRHDPWFKPGWVPECFWSMPWLEGFSAWRLSWLRHAQLPSPPPAGSQRFAWLLRALECRPRVGAVPQVLLHRQGLPAASSPVKASALAEHLFRLGEGDVVVSPREQPVGSYSLQWPLPQGLSCRVVIPSRDQAELLELCLQSLTDTGTALSLEIVVVDNGSTQPAFERLLQRWGERLGSRFGVLRDPSPFNWSQLNNRGAAGATTDVLLFLNNDIEAQRSGWLEAMAAQARRPVVGAVGGVLLYPDGSLQHAGVVVGMHGGADHAYRHLPPDHGVHRGRSRCLSGWGAVTGACLMVRRELFERVGGFDEALPVEFNDIDFCLRLGQLGYRNVIPPEAVLVHHESQSRDASSSVTAEPALRRMQALWGPRLASTAPWWPAQCEDHWADGRPLGLDFGG